MKNKKNQKSQMIKKVFIFSEIEWDFLKQRHQLLADHLHRSGYEVHFVQKVPSRLPAATKLFSHLIRMLIGRYFVGAKPVDGQTEGVYLHYSRFFPQSNPIFRFYNRYFATPYYAKRLAGGGVGYLFSPSASELTALRSSHNFKIVFDVIHNWWQMPWATATSIAAADNLIRKADQVICDSAPLAEHLISNHRVEIEIVLPGVSEGWLVRPDMTGAVDQVPALDRRIVFFGNLRENSDLVLIKSLARAGFLVDAYGAATDTVRQNLKNLVNFKPALPQYELLAAVQTYDFTLLPYSIDDFSKWISPAKYFEVLSLGKPILTRSRLNHMPGWRELCAPIEIERNSLQSDLVRQVQNIQRNYHEKSLASYALSISKAHAWPKQLKKIEKVIEACM